MWNLIIYTRRLGFEPHHMDRVRERFPHAYKFLEKLNLLGMEAGDYEDSAEMWARIDSMCKHIPFEEIHPVVVSENTGSTKNPFFGPIPNSYAVTDKLSLSREEADEYYSHPQFPKVSGRYFHTPYLEEGTNEEIRTYVENIAKLRDENNWSGVVLKFHSHGKIPPVFFTNDETVDEMMNAFSLFYELHGYAVSFQEHVIMEDEYRFFITNGKAVTGAGCIEEFTPMNGRGMRFDERVEGKRGSGHIREDKALVERMRAFADSCAQKLAKSKDYGFYVLDVAQMKHGNGQTELGVVELNGIRNSGLYASDHDIVVAEAIQHPEFFLIKPLNIFKESK